MVQTEWLCNDIGALVTYDISVGYIVAPNFLVLKEFGTNSYRILIDLIQHKSDWFHKFGMNYL